MKRLHNLLFLLLSLNGCNKAHQMGMLPVGDPVRERVPPPDQSSVLAKQTFFTASGGHLVSFAQEDGIWVATVDKKLPPGFSSSVKLPVHCAAGFSVETLADYSSKEQRNLIHVQQTSDGQAIVYVGRGGLPGGGKWHYNMCSKDGCRRDRLRCGRCDWECFEGTDGGTIGLWFVPIIGPAIIIGREIANGSPGTSHCNFIDYCELHCTCVCSKHIVLCPKCYACPHCGGKCKQCCGCSERIAAEKELERKRREEEEKEEAERRRRAEEARRRYDDSSSDEDYSYTPSTSTQAREAERKRKEEEERRKKEEAAMSSLLADAMGITSSTDADTSASADTTHTSTVNRQW